MIKKQMTEEEKRWQARSDARTLGEAETIKADKERYANALSSAQELAQERIDSVKGLAKVAGMKAPKTPCRRTEKVQTPFVATRHGNQATVGRL